MSEFLSTGGDAAARERMMPFRVPRSFMNVQCFYSRAALHYQQGIAICCARIHRDGETFLPITALYIEAGATELKKG
ncbi:hypothetical protein [Rhizobium sp. BE258]|uniref:hypothetical protein n=1 Tax=Rhizobium sp. BE258 TaxID=2817722 RepID=UPI00285D948E|nr:hypothetical protein [Rhizobium sp. BE258]MDR7144378.1 hypothetical protein [Rhizobium sp. BE258]